MKIISWNVNGIRACENKGLIDFIEKFDPDVFCTQETKAHREQLNESLTNPKKYTTHWNSAIRKGYSGTSVWVRQDHKNYTVTNGTGKEEFDDEGRIMQVEFDNFILINGYYPNGKRDLSRVDYKLKFSRYILEIAKKLQQKKPVILTGDFNTAHFPIDLKNPKSNENTTGFLPIEREFLDELTESGFVDVFRFFHPDEADQYTWWTYRGDCRERNIGWRIDYFFASESIIDKIEEVGHLPEILGSDHCPLYLKLNFKN